MKAITNKKTCRASTLSWWSLLALSSWTCSKQLVKVAGFDLHISIRIAQFVFSLALADSIKVAVAIPVAAPMA
jgi:hypothetical protein